VLVIFWPFGTVDPYGSCFNADVSAARDLRVPLADRRVANETLLCDRKFVPFSNPGPKSWGYFPRKQKWKPIIAKFGVFFNYFKLS